VPIDSSTVSVAGSFCCGVTRKILGGALDVPLGEVFFRAPQPRAA